MFNLTIKADRLKDLRGAMSCFGLDVEVEHSFVSSGIRILDVAVGTEDHHYRQRVARVAEKFQY